MITTDITPTDSGAPVRREPLAVELINPLWADRDGLHDALATTSSATDWLASVATRLPAVPAAREPSRRSLTASEANRLRSLRDAVRVVAADVTADPRAVTDRLGRESRTFDDAVSEINRAAESLPARLLRRAGSVVTANRRSTTPFAASTAGFAVDAIPLLAGDHESGPLRACLAPGCVLYFVQDHRRREWCCPACGNRARVARHYERTQAAKRGSTTL